MIYKDNVCALVVTYNRKKILLECLEAIKKQTRSVQGIYLIDNASTDGTPELLFEKGYITELPPKDIKEPWEKEFIIHNLTDGGPIKLHYVRMHENTGGAGGFYEGLRRGYEKSFDWLWLMDDDSIPYSNALEELINAKEKIKKNMVKVPLILASKVVWIDGTLHPMNIPPLDTRNMETFFEIVKYGYLKIRGSSFVSIIINRKCIAKYKYPYKSFFIWSDDVEYTHRILNDINNIGLLVPDSVVIHKTKDKYTPKNISKEEIKKYFYEIRNKIWLLKTKSFTVKEKLLIFLYTTIDTLRFLKKNIMSPLAFYVVIKGIFKGLLNKPRY